MEIRQHCGTRERRQKVLASQKQIGGLELNGIDFLEVLDQDAPSEQLRQRLIDLVFLKPDGVLDGDGDPLLGPANIVIEGGTRIRGIDVTGVEAGADARTLRLTLDRAGDFSRYVLRLRSGAGNDDPPGNMDPVLSGLAFSFKADCPTDFDCAPSEGVAASPDPSPALDYLVKDYESFRRLMLDRMAVILPAWTERSPADLGVTLVEVLAYAADMASYYQDAVATEAYLPRARRRESVRRHARLLGYPAGEGTNARVWIAINAAQDAGQPDAPALPKGTVLLTRPRRQEDAAGLGPAIRPDPALYRELLNAGAIVFETMEDLAAIRQARNRIAFHSWGGADCCLPAGTTVAHLVGTAAELGLSKGEVLILEEQTPRGGTADDPPDPAHRQAVRLAEDPIARIDPLDDTPVLEVRWHAADALAFPLNLAGAGARPGAIARGNVVLADHGRTLDFRFANSNPEPMVNASLHADLKGQSGLDPETVPPGGVYRPCLGAGPVTQAVRYDPRSARERPATDALIQDVGAAVPQLTLWDGGEIWSARGDLLGSGRYAPEFVVETANDGTASVRFGDGRFGKRPAAGAGFLARLRVGNGPDGLIGADAIGHLLTDDPDVIGGVTNPLPALGGAAPERLTTIKINAPRAFRRQRRAVTAADYAGFAEAHSDVQRATAERRWTGSWHTMFLAVDPVGGRVVDAPFEADLRAHLEPVRLAGHDLEIEPPAYVPLDIALAVCVARGHYAADVARALLDAFGADRRADGAHGFFHPDNFTFGTPVRLSRMIAEAMALPGVQWIGLRLEGIEGEGRFRRLHDQSVDYGDAGVIPIGAREVARLDNDPNAPENGRLRFLMEGGR